MVLKKRAKRTPIGRRRADTEYPQLTFDQAFDLVVSAECAEGLRERT